MKTVFFNKGNIGLNSRKGLSTLCDHQYNKHDNLTVGGLPEKFGLFP
jgi:hypothetical protein